MVIVYTVPVIWQVTGVIIFHYGLFFALLLLGGNSQKNEHFQKNLRNSWRYHQFTQAYQKS